MAERMEVLFRVETTGDPRHIVLDGSPDSPAVKRRGRGGNFAYVKYRNVIAQIPCGLCQITLASCFNVTQVEEILNEVKFSEYVETGECKTEIDLPDFIRCQPY